MKIDSSIYFQQQSYGNNKNVSGNPANPVEQANPGNNNAKQNLPGNPQADSAEKIQEKLRQQKILEEVQRLKAIEQKVIAHEMAHKTAAGKYAGAVNFERTTGPDGKSYIVGGEVSIDVSEGSSPEETVKKMDQVKRAALAPADPSSQDQKVAAEASMKQQKARQELMAENNNPNPSQKSGIISIYA